MQKICCNNVDVPIGKMVYTGVLNDFGCYESDITVIRLDDNEYMFVAPTNQAVKDKSWC